MRINLPAIIPTRDKFASHEFACDIPNEGYFAFSFWAMRSTSLLAINMSNKISQTPAFCIYIQSTTPQTYFVYTYKNIYCANLPVIIPKEE